MTVTVIAAQASDILSEIGILQSKISALQSNLSVLQSNVLDLVDIKTITPTPAELTNVPVETVSASEVEGPAPVFQGPQVVS